MKIVARPSYDTFFLLTACAIFFAFLIFTINGEDGLLRLLKLKGMRNELRAKNHALMMENLSLRQEQKSLHSLKTIEQTAHATLGLAYPDEIVFVLGKDNASSFSDSIVLPPSEE